MRLNFSGVGEDDIREGVRRIGKVVGEQVALYGTLTGAGPARRARAGAAPPTPSSPTCWSCRAAPPGAPKGADEPRRGPEGRPLARAAGSLRSGAQVEDALERLGHEVSRSTSAPTSSTACDEARPDVAFVALHGRDGEDGTVQELLEVARASPTRLAAPAACIRCWDKVLTKHLLRDAGIPTPDFHAFSETAFRELGAAQALPAIEARLEFPLVVKPAARARRWGSSSRRTAADVPGALVAAFSYDRKVLLERYVAGRDLAVS